MQNKPNLFKCQYRMRCSIVHNKLCHKGVLHSSDFNTIKRLMGLSYYAVIWEEKLPFFQFNKFKTKTTCEKDLWIRIHTARVEESHVKSKKYIKHCICMHRNHVHCNNILNLCTIYWENIFKLQK